MKGNNNTIAKKIVNIILDVLIVLLAIILLITIYNNIQIKILGNDYASFFGNSVFEVQTGSMEPEISAGDWIIVKYEKNIQLNDIVTFEHKGQYITHRVIEAYNGTYVTKGDANSAKDAPISKDKIIGKVTKVLPHFGILRKTIFNPIVLMFLIITCYLINITFKKPSEKEQLLEKEIIETVKKIAPKKKKTTKEKVVEEQTIEENEEVVEQLEEEQEVKEEVVEETKVEEPEIIASAPVEENEEDMDKTVFYRMVSVSEDEISKAYNTPVMIEENVEVSKVVEPEPEVSENEVKMTLELIQKKKKRCTNFIEKAIFIKEQEIEEIINLLNLKAKEKTNEPTIRQEFTKFYIDAKYYNNCGEVNLEYNAKNMNSVIEKALKEYGEELTKKYKGSDKQYAEKVEKYLKYFLVLHQFEQAFEKEVTIDERRTLYLDKLNKYVKLEISDKDMKALLTDIIKIEKKYSSMIKFLLDKLSTGMFELEYNKTSEKDYYAIELKHNIAFSKVYSEYIVDKTYSEGIVAEDKVEVLASLLIAQLVKNMMNKDFKSKYIIYISGSLYEKDVKLTKVFKTLDDDFIKNNINILVKYEDLAKYKKIIKDLKKKGYNFSVDMTGVEKIKKTDEAMLHIVDFIFIKKEDATKTNIIEIIPEEVKSKITYDDISSKVGSF